MLSQDNEWVLLATPDQSIVKVLVACEYSGRVRDAFRRAGHEAWSCDTEPTETIGLHYQGDVLDILDDGWDLAA